MTEKQDDNVAIPSSEEPIDPPRTSDERTMLLSYLDFYRAVLLRKCAGLNAEELQRTAAATTLTLGRLLRHMAFVEDHWFEFVLHGRDYPAPWHGADWDAQPDWEMDTSSDYSPTELAAQFAAAIERSRTAIDSVDLDDAASRLGPTGPTSVRWILVHMIEEYARHCGHADLLREAVDGQVGD
jgi:uncharacterized damage-inducible protein DinB